LSDARIIPPEQDEVEVSIFGPGKGESIAVHTGAGEWLIVDSCVDQKTGQIPVLNYLRGMGVNVSEDVHLVVGTHAHDDHIAGLARVLDACRNATFVCSSALTADEFFCAMEADADIEEQIRQSIRREYRDIFDIINDRAKEGRSAPLLKRAVEQLTLRSRVASGSTPAARITALSPSHHAVTRATEAIAKGLARAGARRHLGAADPNELAVALSVVVGDTAVLLGADLLRGPGGCGWQAVLATFTPDVLASVFKVPHHGSPNARHEDVWTQLLATDVVSLLAPFRAGRRPLPQPSDIEWLKERSSAVFCSANPRVPAPSKDVRQTRADLTGLAANVRAVGAAGQVRARRACGAVDWEVVTFDPALRL
jgi:beta-lactamase superfamily II metal-dependent hydrolase